MTERPIIFSASMIKAILDDRKSMTRRVIKPQPERVERHIARLDANESVTVPDGWSWRDLYVADGLVSFARELALHCPHGQQGDRLWVREAWAVSRIYDSLSPRDVDPGAKVAYGVDKPKGVRLRSSIHMPRWASRIDLEIVDVRAERLQEIGFADIRAEGFDCPEHDFASGFCASECASLRMGFAVAWEHLNAKRGFPWDSDPWVWALEFRRIRP